MGFRFRKSIKIGPARINLSKSGVGYSIGTKGLRYTKPAKGKSRTTASIPGTGISYTTSTGSKRKSNKSAAQTSGYSSATNSGGSLPVVLGVLAALVVIYLLREYWLGLLLLGVIIVCIYLLIRFTKARNAAELQAQIEAEREKLMAEKAREAERQRLEQERLEAERLEQEREKQELLAAEAEAQRKAEPKAYKVAGVQYYINNLLSMMEANYLYAYKKQDLIDTFNYNMPIYKTVCTATNMELVQEDDNSNDSNAVVVLLDQKIVGYIPRKECKHIRHLMDNDLVESFTFEVFGGKYKQVNEDYDWEKDKSTYTMETGEAEYGITIFIKEKLA